MKYYKEDIKIGGEGWYVLQQIRNSDYWRLEKVADELGISSTSLKSELKRKKIRNSLREKLIELNFEILTEEEQLNKYIYVIRNNINKYCDKEDIKLHYFLLELCKQKNNKKLELIVRGNIVYNRFFNGLKKDSENCCEELIIVTKDLNYIDLNFYFIYLSAYFSYINQDYKKSLDIINGIEYTILINIKDEYVKYRYYRLKPTIMQMLILESEKDEDKKKRKLRKVRKLYFNAINKLKNYNYLGYYYYDIANSFFFSNLLNKAIHYYKLAYNKLDNINDGEMKAIIQNNIAEMYIELGDEEKANEHINISIKYINEQVRVEWILYIYNTYLNINYGEISKENIISLLDTLVKELPNNKYLIMSLVKNKIKNCLNKYNVIQLKEILNLLTIVCINCYDYKRELSLLIVQILMNLYEKEEAL